MPSIEVKADLRALNKWAQESRIASEAEDPRRGQHSAREHSVRSDSEECSSHSRSLGEWEVRSERKLSRRSQHSSVGRSSTTTADKISEEVLSRGVRSSSRLAESDVVERSRDISDISRSSTRKGTLDLPRSSSRHSNASSRPSALMELPASDPLASLPKLLRQISTNTDASAPSAYGAYGAYDDDSQVPLSAYDLALQNGSPTSRATATYANNQLVLVPQDCAARQTPKMRKMSLGQAMNFGTLDVTYLTFIC
eukprot:Skav220363  [mRNA]  locus=scaffold609:94867:95628:+ [translate_table: standard]